MSEDHFSLISPLRDMVSPREWAGLTRFPTRVHSAGQVLLRQGSEGTHVLVLLAGLVKIIRRDHDGRQRLLAFRGSGEIVGELSVQHGGRRLADVWTMSACEASVVPAEDFQRFVRENGLGDRLAQVACHRLREETLGRDGTVHERLAVALLRLVEVSGGLRSFTLTREDLAQHIHAGRKAVSKALEQLGPDLVRVGKSRVEVVDPKKLRAVVGSRLTVRM